MPSECCATHTLHFEPLRMYKPPHFAPLWSTCEAIPESLSDTTSCSLPHLPAPNAARVSTPLLHCPNWLATTVLAWVHSQLGACLSTLVHLSFSPQGLCEVKPLRMHVCALLALVGEGASRLLSRTICPLKSDVPTQKPWPKVPHQGLSPSAYTTSLPTILKHPLLILTSKLHISSDSVGCSLCSSKGQLSEIYPF